MALSNAAKDIVIKIRADDSQYQSALKKTDSSTSAFASSMATYGKTIGLAFASASVALAGYSINAAANYEQLERGFSSLVESQGKDVDTYLAKLKEATRGTSSQADLLKQANQGMLLGLDIDTMVQMAEGAAVIAQATGQSTDYLFQSMALGTARQSRLILDNLGIIVDSEQAYQNYADALGKTTEQLSEQEKTAAFTQAAMDGLNARVEMLGGYSESTNSNIATFRAGLEDLSVSVGNEFLPSVNAVITAINEWGNSGGFEAVHGGIQGLIDVVDSVGFGAVIDGLTTVAELYKTIGFGASSSLIGSASAVAFSSPNGTDQQSQINASMDRWIAAMEEKKAAEEKALADNTNAVNANTAALEDWGTAGKNINDSGSRLTSLSDAINVGAGQKYNIATGTYSANTSGADT